MAVSFENDIMPFFAQYKGQMGWRMDITSYDDVKANAELIRGRINPSPENFENRMPPPPFPAFSQQLYDNFVSWINEGYPP